MEASPRPDQVEGLSDVLGGAGFFSSAMEFGVNWQNIRTLQNVSKHRTNGATIFFRKDQKNVYRLKQKVHFTIQARGTCACVCTRVCFTCK